MGIQIDTNFELNSRQFLDKRSSCESLEVLESLKDEVLYPRGFEVYCEKEDQWYINVGCETCGDCPRWEPRGLNGVQIENFVTKDFLDGKLDSLDIPNIEGLATEEFVGEQIQQVVDEKLKEYDTTDYIIGRVDERLDDFATKKYVKEEINKIDIPEVDLKPYATKDYVESYVDVATDNIITTRRLATKEYVDLKVEGIDIPEVDLTPYVTKEFAEGMIAPLASKQYLKEELNKYSTQDSVKDQLDETVEKMFDELSSKYATHDFVQGAVELMLTDEEAVEFYATKEFVKNEIAKAQLDGGDVDVSGLATKADLSLKADRNHIHSYNELTDKPEIPSIEGLATEDFVREQIDAIELPEIDFSGLASKEELDGVREQIPSIEGLATEDFVREQIDAIEIPEVEIDLSGLATKEELSDKADAGHVHGDYVLKEEGKSLVADEELKRLAMLENYDDTEIRSLLSKIIAIVDVRPEYVQPSFSLEVSRDEVEAGKDEEVVINPVFMQNDAGLMTGYILKRGEVELVNSDSVVSFKDVLNTEQDVIYYAEVFYGDGEIKESSLGIPDEEGRILAGAISTSVEVKVKVVSSKIFYGKLPGDVEKVDETHFAMLDSQLSSSKEFTLILDGLDEEKPVYIYPAIFGDLKSALDGDMAIEALTETFNKDSVVFEDVEYNVYIFKEPVWDYVKMVFS